MALILPRSVFFHIPKTGGEWVYAALSNSGVLVWPAGMEGLDHKHSAPEEKGRFRFCFVRNPVDWYRSFWSYKSEHGWNPHVRQEELCKSPRFEEFVEKMLEFCPAYVTQLYEMYVGPPRAGKERVDFIGRTERLADDLILALRTAGERFSEEKVREVPAANVSWQKPEYPLSLKKRVAESEHEAMIRFGYQVEDPYPSMTIPDEVLVS